MNDLVGDAPAASLLLIVTVAVSMVALKWAPGLVDRGVFRPYWLLRRPAWGTLVSSGFLHADLGHLLANGFTLWAFGPGLERAIGTPRFLALYALGLVLSNVGTWLRHRNDAEYSSLGASGAITAVLFAAIVYFPDAKIMTLPIPVPIPAPLFAVSYLAYTAWAARQARGRINHDAHLGGALVGVLFVLLTDPAALGRSWQWATH